MKGNTYGGGPPYLKRFKLDDELFLSCLDKYEALIVECERLAAVYAEDEDIERLKAGIEHLSAMSTAYLSEMYEVSAGKATE